MLEESMARVREWIVESATWLGEQAEVLALAAVDWVRDMGVFGYALGAGVALVWILLALWYSSRR